MQPLHHQHPYLNQGLPYYDPHSTSESNVGIFDFTSGSRSESIYQQTFISPLSPHVSQPIIEDSMPITPSSQFERISYPLSGFSGQPIGSQSVSGPENMALIAGYDAHLDIDASRHSQRMPNMDAISAQAPSTPLDESFHHMHNLRHGQQEHNMHASTLPIEFYGSFEALKPTIGFEPGTLEPSDLQRDQLLLANVLDNLRRVSQEYVAWIGQHLNVSLVPQYQLIREHIEHYTNSLSQWYTGTRQREDIVKSIIQTIPPTGALINMFLNFPNLYQLYLYWVSENPTRSGTEAAYSRMHEYFIHEYLMPLRVFDNILLTPGMSDAMYATLTNERRPVVVKHMRQLESCSRIFTDYLCTEIIKPVGHGRKKEKLSLWRQI